MGYELTDHGHPLPLQSLLPFKNLNHCVFGAKLRFQNEKDKHICCLTDPTSFASVHVYIYIHPFGSIPASLTMSTPFEGYTASPILDALIGMAVKPVLCQTFQECHLENFTFLTSAAILLLDGGVHVLPTTGLFLAHAASAHAERVCGDVNLNLFCWNRGTLTHG